MSISLYIKWLGGFARRKVTGVWGNGVLGVSGVVGPKLPTPCFHIKKIIAILKEYSQLYKFSTFLRH